MFPSVSVLYIGNIGSRNIKFPCQAIGAFLSASYFSNLGLRKFGQSISFTLWRTLTKVSSRRKVFQVFSSIICSVSVYMIDMIPLGARTNKCFSYDYMSPYRTLFTFMAQSICKVFARSYRIVWFQDFADMGSSSRLGSHEPAEVTDCVKSIGIFNWFPYFRGFHVCQFI